MAKLRHANNSRRNRGQLRNICNTALTKKTAVPAAYTWQKMVQLGLNSKHGVFEIINDAYVIQ